MFPCPKCRTRFPFYRILFYTKNTEFVCKHCGTVSKIRYNYWSTFLCTIPAVFIGTWIYRSHFSVLSIVVFFLYTAVVTVLASKFEKLEILYDADH